MRKYLLIISLCAVFFSCDKNGSDNTPALGSMPSNMIKKIVIDINGTMWVLTDKGVNSFILGNWYYHPDLESVNNAVINDISLNNQANRLLLSTNIGAYDLTISGDKISSITKYSRLNSEIKCDTVWSSCYGLNGEIYFGTDSGLQTFAKNKWYSFDGYLSGGRTKGKMLVNYKTTAIAVAKNNWGYACTFGAGVSRFNSSDTSSIIDASTGATAYDGKYGVGSDTVYTVLITDDTCQWFGTAKGAGYHIVPSTKRGWTFYNIENGDGLICDSVLSIAKDQSENMWFGTYKGISKFDGTIWTSYTTKDKLANNKVNSIAVDVDGSLWFGTDGGLSHFTDGEFSSFSIK